ncbi:MAG TPA: benzoate-CoA ligase family protein [Pyrinomonadaceae bacterium]|nr:benzoate-CoA ligase family protein [Pyrinomonadaceae bacterium]
MSLRRQLGLANASQFYLDGRLEGGGGADPALRFENRATTYEELFHTAGRAGNLFAESGVGFENRVVLILPDSPLFVAAFFGLMRIGAVPVPVSTRLAPAEYLYILADCRPEAVVITSEHRPMLDGILRQLDDYGLPRPSHVWVTDSDLSSPPYEPLARHLDGAVSLCRVRPTRGDDVALIQYTSGSTGIPKGVVHLHRGLLEVARHIPGRLKLHKGDVCFSAAKLSFGYGLGNSVFFPLSVGACSVLMAGPADPYSVYDTVRRELPTVFFGVPSLYSAILSVPRCATEFDLSSVRLFVSAGERLSAGLFKRWKETFGSEIVEGFGSTECLHVFISSEEGCIKPGSTGTLIEGNEAKLVGDDGRPAAVGEPGELYVKSGANAARYWNRQDETAATMVGPWTRTGDVLYCDEDGYFFFVGRTDDLLKVGGLKVSPAEIEEALLLHEAVAECAVVCPEREDGTNVIVAYVRPREGWEAVSGVKRKLRAHLGGLLASHKLPREIIFVSELPRTFTGKVARYKLRSPAEAPR